MDLNIEEVKASSIRIDVAALAASGFGSISEDDRYRLKAQGISPQRQAGLFMIRIRVPGGKASPFQLRKIAALADRYGHNRLHVTTRGGLEIHHVKIEDAPAILEGLSDVGLTTKGACGDTLRNVVACAHVGTHVGEVLPLEPFVRLVHEHIIAISDTTNISRKMNVAFACSPQCDEQVATSDIGFVATERKEFRDAGFAVWGAGGLGATPRLAIQLLPFIEQIDILPAFMALVRISERYGDRTDRARAKIKLLVERWGPDRFREVFAEEFAEAQTLDLREIHVVNATGLSQNVPPPLIGTIYEQRQAGRFTIPALIPMGELSTDAARTLAAAAELFGDETVHLTSGQNAELQDVARDDVDKATEALRVAGIETYGRGGITDVVSCVGLDFCGLAVADSMSLGETVRRAMAARIGDSRYADFRIAISGCPHSCAKHQVADIGLSGGTAEIEGTRLEVFTLYFGGNARERRLGRAYPEPIPRAQVMRAIEDLLSMYEIFATDGERFSQTVARIGDERFLAAIRVGMGRAAPVEEAPLCLCNNVSRETVVAAIRAGASDLAAIGRMTSAGTDCGTCRGEIASVIMAPQAQPKDYEVAPLDRPQALRFKARLDQAFRRSSSERAIALRRLAEELRTAASLLDGVKDDEQAT